MTKWYIMYNGQQIGPMSANELMAYNPTPQTQVWHEGMASWQPLYAFPELMTMLNQQRNVPPTPGVPPVYGKSATGKEKDIAGILAIVSPFLSGLGLHYFYCGKILAGFLSLLLTWATCGAWAIVILIQAIKILVGSQEEFEQKYVFTDKSFPLF